MSIVTVTESTGTVGEYEAMTTALDQAGAPMPPVHIAGPVEGGFRDINVWASQDDVDAVVEAANRYLQSQGYEPGSSSGFLQARDRPGAQTGHKCSRNPALTRRRRRRAVIASPPDQERRGALTRNRRGRRRPLQYSSGAQRLCGLVLVGVRADGQRSWWRLATPIASQRSRGPSCCAI